MDFDFGLRDVAVIIVGVGADQLFGSAFAVGDIRRTTPVISFSALCARSRFG
jgi:hypothetical protein